MRKLWPFPPGVAIAMSAIPVFIVSLAWEHLTPMYRSAGIGVFILLVAAEIRAIYKDRAERDNQFLAFMVRIEDIQKASRFHADSIERLRGVVNDPIGSLKARAVRLSADLIDWTYKRLENWPHFGSTVTVGSVEYLKITSESSQYEKETEYFYIQRFGPKVNAIRGEMAQQGIVDVSLENACNDKIISADTMLFIGKRIGELADEIKT
ncbi:MAG: hypothetical protein ABSD98_19375 [Candidatus Korobacteraceae bacterium]|jgi:hypothetical protein